MPYLEIKACVDCPYKNIDNYAIPGLHNSEDTFAIACFHENQVNKGEYYEAKIKNRYNSIYFNCPLPMEIKEEDD